MPARVTSKRYNRVDLIEVGGRIDAETAPLLDQELQRVIGEGRYCIVVDMSQIDFMSTAGLRVLLSAQKKASALNRGDVRLASMPGNVKKAFDLAGFLELFKVYDSCVDAVGSF